MRRATTILYSCPGRIWYFYPRSPCGERQLYINRTAETVIFLSTLSLRRATVLTLGGFFTACISIHALLAESDRRSVKLFRQNFISIHALLAESDPYLTNYHFTLLYFYPRSPCGERPDQPSTPGKPTIFLSTLSLRRATLKEQEVRCKLLISIHALLAESDTLI